MKKTTIIKAVGRSSATIPDPVQLTVVRANTLCESIRKRKLIWSVISIIMMIVVTATVTISLVIRDEKEKEANTSTTTTTTTLVTTVITTEMTTDITTEESSNNGKNIITNKSTWEKNGTMIAGGNGEDGSLERLNSPSCMYLDADDQIVYVSEIYKHRVVEWKFNATSGRIVAGGNGVGNALDQLTSPWGIVLDKPNDSIIICDRNNRRIVRWSRQNTVRGYVIISDISCTDIELDNNGSLYVADVRKGEVWRWRIGDDQGVLVAGGNDVGQKLNQLRTPLYIFVDADYSVYVSECENGRVTKWVIGAQEGVVVAGIEREEGFVSDSLCTAGITVDQLGNVYAVMAEDRRVTRWIKGKTEGSDIIDGDKEYLMAALGDIAFDKYGNLYLLDSIWGRVQRFLLNTD